MKKVYLLLAVAATMFAACSTKDNLEDSSGNSQQAALAPGEVGFDAYTQRTTTRNGQSGIMDITTLQTSGFGVFGYYTDNNEYEQSRIPDFMYNQQVNYTAALGWSYDPVKYWPNEYGSSANSDDNDKVSFFAYAPWVEVQPSIGKVVKVNSNDDQWGITALSRNSASGDPLVKYIANFEADKRVDLLWGVCDDPQWSIVQGGTVQQINEGVKGLPWLNVERPRLAETLSATTQQRMKFTFKHALSQFSVNVDAFVDGYNATNALDSKTKIYVRQISFTGFAMKGALNLNNVESDKALWLDYNGAADIESGAAVTIYDGRKDGKEGTAGADASNEKFRGLNPTVISDYNESTGKGNTQEGVTNVTKSLFESTDPVMVIPTGEDMEVEIIYDVETEDDNLSTTLSDGKTPGSSIENRITKTVSFGSDGMQNGKHYTLSLHLGMNSVKFDAAVSDWQEASVKPEADLPLNMPSFSASSPAIEKEVELTCDAQPYMFAVYGLTPDEQVTASIQGTPAGTSVLGQINQLEIAGVGDFTGSTISASPVIGTVNASGVTYIRLLSGGGGIVANNTVKNIAKDGYISVKGATSNKEVKISFAQLAHKLDLGVTSIDATAGDIVLSSGATVNWTTDVAVPDNTDNSSIIIKKNGVRQTYNPTPTPGSNEFSWNAGTKTISLASGASVAGDVYEITVKAGDAEKETYVASVGGITLKSNAGNVTFRESPYTYAAIPYTIVSNTTQIVTWSAAGTNASVNASTGKISTIQAGNETITATIAPTNGNGWYYPAALQTGNYTLTVDKQDATVAIAPIAAPVAGTAGTATVICTMAETLTGSITGDLSAIAPANKGTVTYSVDDTTNFSITAAGVLSTTTTPVAGSYPVTVTATMTDGTCYHYPTSTATYTITVTVN